MATPIEIHEHFAKGEKTMEKEFVKGNAPDGIHENIVFNEWKDPSYWMRRRAMRAFVKNVGPVLIVLGMVSAFVVMGLMEATN